jgi:hypothetical protein
MGWPEAVLFIVLVVTVGKVISSRYRAMNGILEDEDGNQFMADKQGSKMLQDEVKNLNARIAVLERVITDDRDSKELAKEIEDLRSR